MRHKNFFISIPEPCHEDWGKMTKQEKGRHCSACSKTVYDFTHKSQQEIEEAFAQNLELCGRFMSSQLKQPYKMPYAERFNLAKFTAACFLVFGLSLFNYSCALETPHFNLVDLLQEQVIQGKVTPPDTLIQTQTTTATVTEAIPLDTTNVDSLDFEEVIIPSSTHIISREIIFAGIPIKVATPTVLREIEPRINLESSLEIFPNPSSDFFKLKYTPLQSDSTSSEIEIRIYDTAGRLVEDESYPFQGGTFETKLSLTGRTAGIYILQIVNGQETLKTKLIKKD